MHILPVLAVTAGLLVEANSEAFFVANLLGGNNVRSSRPGFVRAPAPAPGRVHHPAPRPSREVGGQAHYPSKQNFQKPQRHQKPQFSKKPVFLHRPGYPKAKPLHHVNQQPGRLTHHANKPRLPTYPKTKADPGANQKLDYGGWKPIDFDDSLPSERKPVASKPSAVKVEVHDPQIVTLDAAIAAAPPAQTDDIQHPILTVYEPLVKTVSASYTAPQAVVTKAAQPPSNSVSTIYSDSKPYQPKSSYGSPVPAVPYIPSTAEHSPTYVTSNNAPQPSYQVLHANNPAVAPAYEAPKPKFQTPQYLPRPAVPKPLYKSTPSPARPPKYEPEPAVAPKYEQPAAAPRYQLAPAPAPAYEAAPGVAQEAAPAAAPAYEAPDYQTVVTAKPDVVILPAYTPAPPAFSSDPSYSEPQELYENTQFEGEEFPIVALITAESDVPEHEKFVSFSIGGSDNAGSPDTVAPPGEYQATQDNTRLAKDVSSGSVYVQQGDKQSGKTDELYYIYYQDPELDPSYGVKIQSEREAKFIEAPVSTLDAPSLGQAPGLDIPLYDYDEAASAETFRSERDQPTYAESYTNQRSARQPAGYEFDPEPSNPFYKTSSKSSSSVSFNLNVGGKTSGFSYSL